MTPEQRKKAWEIFRKVDEISPDQVSAFLDQTCGSDPEVRQTVEGYIAEEDVDDSSLENIVAKAREELASLSDPLVGQTILDGKYRIEAYIAVGGMGTVYKAYKSIMGADRLVALKILHLNLATGKLGELFKREIEITAALQHSNIITILDADEINIAGSTTLYIAMEWVDGSTLKDEIEKSAPFTLRRIANILQQIAEALEYTHKKGIVHRDLTPSNIMLINPGEEHEQVKILDFGIAKVVNDASRSKIVTQVGTPLYASSEQLSGEPVNKLFDIFSLGIVIHEMLTGSSRPNYNNFSNVPEGIKRLVNRMLSKRQGDRPQSAKEVFEAFSEVLNVNILPPLVFICFHPEEKQYHDELLEMLQPSVKQGIYEVFSEQDITRREWTEDKIDKTIVRTRIGIVIAGAYYPDPRAFSDNTRVLCRLISKSDKKDAVIIHLYAGPVPDDIIKRLDRFEPVNQPEKYLTPGPTKKHLRQEIYKEVANRIRFVLNAAETK